MSDYQAPPPAYNGTSNSGSSWLSNIGSGLSNAWNSTKRAVSNLGTKTTPASPAYGGRRKRRGGNAVVGFDENWKEYGSAKGGSRKRRGGSGAVLPFEGKTSANSAGPAMGGSRKRRGGNTVVGFDENWKEYGAVNGGKRRKR